MSRSLEIPDAVFSALEAAAEATGTTPVGWITAHLPPSRTNGEVNAASKAKTLADLFAGKIGLISSGGGGALSENSAQKFADGMAKKRQEGHL